MEKPLSGRCILVTRARDQAAGMVTRIEELGGEPYLFPVIMTADPESWAPLDQAICHLEQYRWLVITSPNGANQFAQRLRTAGREMTDLRALKVAAVGAATARTLAKLGREPDVVPGQFRGAALPEAMAAMLQPGERVLMVRGDLADAALPEALRTMGAAVDDRIAYRTVRDDSGDAAALKAALSDGRVHYATFTSGSAITNLLERLENRALPAGVRVAVMGPETKKAAEAAGLPVHVMPPQATIDALIDAIVQDCSD